MLTTTPFGSTSGDKSAAVRINGASHRQTAAAAFPTEYRGDAFVAFHGSWNRAPEPQKGFFVAFVPFKDGKPSGDWEVFADDFAGGQQYTSPSDAKHRPCGLAQGTDGSLYVSDDKGGFIYKIVYKGK